ncbi:MAG TPA: pyridoxal phosphate-dependent aminotransferase, partial [Puia sp.]|nr:pyridoxal phosphate-dependent aminotransferase [Puia sp.]
LRINKRSHMRYTRMPIEAESPEQMGYDKIRNNLSESSYTDAHLRDFLMGGGSSDATGGAAGLDLGDLLLCYGTHEGHEGLRELIVKDTPLTPDQVLLTIGAAGALFIIATTLLEKGDELIVVRPNYATNIETPRAIGAAIHYIDLTFENKWALDIEQIREAITPRTRYISVTHPHNPTGACLEAAQLQELAKIAETHHLYVLVDETYRDMVFGPQLPLAAEYSPRLISVSSLSKTYGLPGLRIGWIICRDRPLLETFLAAKEQIHICGPVVDEELAYRYLLQRDRHFPRIRADIAGKFALVKTWIESQDKWEWVEPRGGCVCFPRMRRPERIDIDKFYELLLKKYGTYVGPGHWFEMPRHYIRLGFGWPSKEQLEEGLDALSMAMRDAAHR